MTHSWQRVSTKGKFRGMRFFDIVNRGWDFEALSKQYQDAEPFPHIVLDDFFEESFLEKVMRSFPVPDGSWWNYDNFMERKWAKDDLRFESDEIQSLVQILQDRPFLEFLEKVSGISRLIPDPFLNGGGLHQITTGGKLDIHVDYNFHPRTHLDRRLNVLVYLNKHWQKEWKGQLELWSPDMKECVQAIDPVFNRVVVFSTTEKSNHGHPEALQCPSGTTRKSIALYYYTNGRPIEEIAPKHSTIFKRRPCDPIDPEQERLRQLRSSKRL